MVDCEAMDWLPQMGYLVWDWHDMGGLVFVPSKLT